MHIGKAGRKIGMGILLAVGILLAGVGRGATFTVNGSQEIGGATPKIGGDIDATPTTNVASMSSSGTITNWTFSWTGLSHVNLSDYTLTYTRISPSDPGTVTFNLGGAGLSNTVDDVVQDGLSIKTISVQGSTLGAAPDRQYWSDSAAITNVGAITLGGIDTSDTRTGGNYSRPHGGNITIGSSGARAGSIHVEYLYADARNSSGASYASGGTVTIYGSGGVLIADSAGNRGDIRTDSPVGNAGTVMIDHAGSLTLRDILAQTSGGGNAGTLGATIKLYGGDSCGDLKTQNIYNYNLKATTMSSSRPLIEIKNYQDVEINNLDGHTPNPTVGRASDVFITNGITGSITITGTIDLSHGGIKAYRGSLRLVAGDMISVAQIDMDKLLYATFSSGGKKSYVTGALANFNTAGSGSGTLADPVVTSQTNLCTAADGFIYYDAAANGYLEGKVYKIADLSMAPGQGGLLMTKLAAGTTILFR